MTQPISYLGVSSIYTGTTTNNTFTLPFNLLYGQTLIAFVSSFGTGLSPVLPNDWNYITEITGTTGTLFAFFHQPTGTIIEPEFTINGLSSIFNTAYIVFLSGCTTNQTKLIHQFRGIHNNAGGALFDNGFTTTVDKTAIIQSVSMYSSPVYTPIYVVNNSWGATTSPPVSSTWINSIAGIDKMRTLTSPPNTYGIYNGCGVSVNSPKTNYSNFYYSLHSAWENLEINLAISPNVSKPNQVLNLFKSF